MTSCLIRRTLNYAKYSYLRALLSQTCATGSVTTRHCATFSHLGEEELREEHEEGENVPPPLYPGHIPTTALQKTLLAAGSALISMFDPTRGHSIATLGDVTSQQALKVMKQKMEEDPVGRQILEEQPVINTQTVSIDYLGGLPDNTFGKAYWRFLNDHEFTPDARAPVQFIDDPDLVYVLLRYRQCHDLVHALLGMKPNRLGEVAVKWVEAVQTGLPMCQTAAFFGPLRLGPIHRQRYLSSYLPWAIRNGKQAKFLMNVYFEKHWETDLDQLRQELNVEPPPPIVK